jgi:hypothetical protein
MCIVVLVSANPQRKEETMMIALKGSQKIGGISCILGIFLFVFCFLVLLFHVQEACAESKKASGTVKTLTELSREFIRTTALKPPFPVGEMLNVAGVYSSDDTEWNKARYYAVWLNENLNFTGHAIITFQGGDQIYCKTKDKVKEVGLHDWTVDHEGWFIGGTGKFEGIKGKWREKIVYVMSKFTIEWEVEYELK